MMFFLTSMELAVVDLLCEGKYAELMVTKPETGSDLVTWVWACYQTGTLMAAMIIGPVADNVSPTVLFFICIPLALQILWPACNNYLPEEQLPPERRGIRWDKLREQKEFFLLAVIMAAGALGLALVNLFAPLLAQLVYSLAISALLCGLGFRWLPPMLAKCNLYMFLQDVLYVQIQGAMDYCAYLPHPSPELYS
jgi:MFS family permease